MHSMDLTSFMAQSCILYCRATRDGVILADGNVVPAECNPLRSLPLEGRLQTVGSLLRVSSLIFVNIFLHDLQIPFGRQAIPQELRYPPHPNGVQSILQLAPSCIYV